jgi:hypothetical protein
MVPLLFVLADDDWGWGGGACRPTALVWQWRRRSASMESMVNPTTSTCGGR